MLTNEDIQKIIEANKQVFATKDDLKSFATKEDLEAFATKEDLEAFATKEDLEAFATKEDLGETSSKLLNEIFSTKDDLQNFKDEMRENFSSLQTSVDSYAKKADSFFQEMVMLSHKVDRQEKWIHELAEKMSVQLKY